MNREELLKLLSNKDVRLRVEKLGKDYESEIKELSAILDDNYTLKDRVEFIRLQLNEPPVCKTCGKIIHWKSGFALYCSLKCHKNSDEFKLTLQNVSKKSIDNGYTREQLLTAITRADGVMSSNRGKYDVDIMRLTNGVDTGYSIKERIQILAENIEPPVCKTCGNIVHWDGSSARWKQFCSIKCSNSNTELTARKVSNKDYDQVFKKVRERCMIKYGHDNAMKSNEVKEKVRNSCGGSIGFGNPITASKARDTMLSLYGTTSHFPSKITKPHQKLIDWVSTLGVEYRVNDRNVLANLELDLYFPNHNFAIEINGLYWHSEKFAGVMDHENKYKRCNDLNIKLLQLWDFEVLYKFSLIQSMISSKLGLNKRIYARHCKVIDISAKDVFEWYQSTHIQGGILKKGKALIHNNEIVAVMVIKNGILERFSSKLNTTVIGGMSKIIKSFNVNEIITYSDNRYSDGRAYLNSGFTLISETAKPKYYYTNDYKSLRNRWEFMKDKMAVMKGFNFNAALTEKENATNNGWVRVYGCGGKKWRLLLN